MEFHCYSGWWAGVICGGRTTQRVMAGLRPGNDKKGIRAQFASFNFTNKLICTATSNFAIGHPAQIPTAPYNPRTMDRHYGGLEGMQHWRGWRRVLLRALVGRNRFIAPIGRAPPHTFGFRREWRREAAQ